MLSRKGPRLYAVVVLRKASWSIFLPNSVVYSLSEFRSLFQLIDFGDGLLNSKHLVYEYLFSAFISAAKKKSKMQKWLICHANDASKAKMTCSVMTFRRFCEAGNKSTLFKLKPSNELNTYNSFVHSFVINWGLFLVASIRFYPLFIGRG